MRHIKEWDVRKGEFVRGRNVRDIRNAPDLGERVFISYTRKDEEEALRVGEKIERQTNLTVWIDILDDLIVGDHVGLITHITETIKKCAGFVAVVSPETKNSWWVPGEFFIAQDNGTIIGTYLTANPYTENLPSYMKGWPIMVDKEDLLAWAKTVERGKTKRSMAYGRNGYRKVAASVYGEPEMQALQRRHWLKFY